MCVWNLDFKRIERESKNGTTGKRTRTSKRRNKGTREMAQRGKAPGTKAVELTSVCRMHMVGGKNQLPKFVL